MQSTTKRRGKSPLDNSPLEITIADGKIRQIETLETTEALPWIAPAMVDIQVNGYVGADYNAPETPLEDLARSIEAQRKCGVARLLPTVITGSHENICGSLRNLAKARRELPAGDAFVAFHVEGPWISPHDGPRGAHPKEHCRAATRDEFDRFQEAADGQVKLVTLGAEVEGALDTIEYMVEQGVTVALGHTDCTKEQIHDAIRAGATMSTHLGNGAHPLIARHANYINEQMAADELKASLIVDGIHLTPSFVKIVSRVKGPERVILVTDAVVPAGSEPGVYRFGHLEVELREDRSVRLTDSGRLAGSALSMDFGLENLLRFTDFSLLEALRCATVNAASTIGLEARTGFLQVGDPADLMLFDYDETSGKITMRETLVGRL